MTRILLALVLVLGLAGCGFHLRNKLMLPTDTAPVKVVSTAPYSELVKLLNRSLRGGMVLRVFIVRFANKTLRAWTFEMPDGKLEQYQVAEQ